MIGPLIARYESVDDARHDLLAHRALGDADLPVPVVQKIREVFGRDLTPAEVVATIIRDVRAEGDAAVHRYTKAIDGREVATLLATREDLDAAAAKVDPEIVAGLEVAAEQIRRFHERARRNSWLAHDGDGALGQVIRPLRRVGIYAPGGRAPYPSSVLMAVVPARVAGVREVVLASPPGPDGEIAPVLLAAAKVAGVDAVYRMGGAQAIAALAYGTDSVGRVDKILGPGNIFVALAKQQVYGVVAIDGLAGPTECLLIADETANPTFLAADLIAQAEHDPLAQPILFCTSKQVIERTLGEAERMIEEAPRASIIRESLAGRGAVVHIPSVEDGIRLANEYAPEHLTLCVRDAWSRLGQVENAGGVFIGEWSAEAIGDYAAGPSHIMPTSGTARFSSPLNLDDFLKITSVFSFGPGDVRRLGPPAIAVARAEGLHAHAAAIEVRLRELMSIQPEVRRSNVRHCIANISAYHGPEDPEYLAKRLGRPVESIIKLDANENPYGPSPLVQEMLSTYAGYSIYPDADQRSARAALAAYAGVPPESLILGNGADELIDLLMRAYLDPGDELIDFPPSFAMYAFNAQLQAAKVVSVPRNDDFSIDVDAALDAITDRTKLILLTSPNNPTGTVMPTADVRRILETGYLVVLDEAYFEFANADGLGFETMIGEVANYPNLVVLRTFSKWAGLAGLRIGYGVFPHEVGQHIWKLKPPFNVNVAALVAMRAALEDKAHLLETVDKIVSERDRLLVELPKTRVVTPYPTRSNFILCEINGLDGRALTDRLADEGILVRHYGTPRLRNCVRISVGRPEQNDVVLSTLTKIADELGV